MADNSSIEWTDATWNPIRGCSRVSEGCRHCYAEGVAARLSGPGLPYDGLAKRVQTPNGPDARWTGVITRAPNETLLQPLRWKAPRKIFVNSMSDLFHEGVPDSWIDAIFAVMALCPQHTFQILTKRPERMKAYILKRSSHDEHGFPAEDIRVSMTVLANRPGQYVKAITWPMANVWLGVSVEDQVTADTRIPYLLDTPAAVRFISAEPLLGPLDISSFMWPVCGWWRGPHRSYREAKAAGAECGLKRQALVHADRRFLDWVIAGGESGPKARPMHPDWATSLRDQCSAADVPFLFKQWGEWGEPTDTLGALDWPYHKDHDRTHWFDGRTCVRPSESGWSDKYKLGAGAWPPPPFDLFNTPEYLDQVARCPQSSCRTEGKCMGNEARAAVTWRGKKNAGRKLNGIEHNAFPETRHVRP